MAAAQFTKPDESRSMPHVTEPLTCGVPPARRPAHVRRWPGSAAEGPGSMPLPSQEAHGAGRSRAVPWPRHASAQELAGPGEAGPQLPASLHALGGSTGLPPVQSGPGVAHAQDEAGRCCTVMQAPTRHHVVGGTRLILLLLLLAAGLSLVLCKACPFAAGDTGWQDGELLLRPDTGQGCCTGGRAV